MLIKFLADGLLPIVIILSIFLIITSPRWWRQVPIMVVSALISLLFAKLTSLVYQPEFSRPFILMGLEPGAAFIDNPGFPSDHVLLATAAVLAVWWVRRSYFIVSFMSILVILMAIGRVLALVHTPIDVVGGLLCGLFGLIWYASQNVRKTS